MRKITDVTFRLPGQQTDLDDKQWAGISLKFAADDDHYREVDLTLLVSNAPSASLLELHDASRDDAIETLRAAIDALEQHGISELAQQAAINEREFQDREDEEAEKRAAAEIARAVRGT